MNADQLPLSLPRAACDFFGRSRAGRLLLSIAFAVTVTNLAGARSVTALKQLSLDELMNVEVMSVSRRIEALHEAAAALTVVTPEHIRRSGATTVPDALRTVPGLHVARQNSNSWALSARGFSSINSQKLLVLSDTRSIYTPLFSGVFWDVQDYLMADLEKIEVIRGPGAALWGSNAVNGIINIVTKHASQTHGTHLRASAGTFEQATVAARHGGVTDGGVHFRVFAKYVDRDESFNNSPQSDAWHLGHIGFRTDWAPTAEDEITIQGDVYRGTLGRLVPAVTIIGRPGPAGDLETDVSGGNLLGRWRHQFSGSSELIARAYYDRTSRNDPSFTDALDTFDLDLQHRFLIAERHDLTWGLNYRYTANENNGKGVFAVAPATSRDHLFSGFVQDQFTWRNGVRITAGTKLEHNEFSGFEVQPSVRASWEINLRHTWWAAVSRAARIPTRLERDISIDVTDPAADPLVRLVGNRDIEPEELLAFELGYRWRAAQSLHFDIALFENRYDGLMSLELGSFATLPDGRTTVPILNRNLSSGTARGAELLANFSPHERWRLTGTYSYLTLAIEPGGQDINRGEFYEDATPRHQFTVSSYLTLGDRFEFDVHFRRSGAIRRLPEIVSGEGLPGYSELDVHLSWLIREGMRVSLVGQNLLHDHHIEFGTPAARGGLRRGGYVRLEYEF